MSAALTRLGAAVVIALSAAAMVVVPSRAAVEGSAESKQVGDLDGRSLVAARVVGRTLVKGTELTLEFEDGYLSADAGCNDGGGRYLFNNGRLRKSGLEVTDMGCGDAIARQEDWFFELLSDTRATLRGSRLVLREGRVSITFIPALDPAQPDAIIDRAWVLTHLKMKGEPLRGLGYRPERDSAPLLYVSDRVALARGSCATAKPNIRIRQAAATITFVTTTSSWNRHHNAGRCRGARGKIDRTMREVLRGRVRIQRTGNQLTLRRGGGVLRFEDRQPQTPESPVPTSP